MQLPSKHLDEERSKVTFVSKDLPKNKNSLPKVEIQLYVLKAHISDKIRQINLDRPHFQSRILHVNLNFSLYMETFYLYERQ